MSFRVYGTGKNQYFLGTSNTLKEANNIVNKNLIKNSEFDPKTSNVVYYRIENTNTGHIRIVKR